MPRWKLKDRKYYQKKKKKKMWTIISYLHQFIGLTKTISLSLSLTKSKALLFLAFSRKIDSNPTSVGPLAFDINSVIKNPLIHWYKPFCRVHVHSLLEKLVRKKKKKKSNEGGGRGWVGGGVCDKTHNETLEHSKKEWRLLMVQSYDNI